MQSTFLIIVNFPRIVGREGGEDREAGRAREAGEERAETGREMQNANYCHLLIR